MIRVMVEVQDRAQLLDFDSEEPALIGDVESAAPDFDVDCIVAEAMVRVLKDKIGEYGKQNPKFSKEVLPNLMAVSDLEELMLQIAVQLPWDYLVRQKYLEALTITGQYEVLVGSLVNEIEVSRIRREFQEKVKACVDKNQKEYFLREQMNVIRQVLGEDPLSDGDEYEKKLYALKADKEVKEKLYNSPLFLVARAADACEGLNDGSLSTGDFDEKMGVLIDQTTTTHSWVGTIYSDLGNKWATMENLETKHKKTSQNLQEEYKDKLGADPYEAITEMFSYQYSYSAALQIGSRLMQSSLFDFIR